MDLWQDPQRGNRTWNRSGFLEPSAQRAVFKGISPEKCVVNLYLTPKIPKIDQNARAYNEDLFGLF